MTGQPMTPDEEALAREALRRELRSVPAEEWRAIAARLLATLDRERAGPMDRPHSSARGSLTILANGHAIIGLPINVRLSPEAVGEMRHRWKQAFAPHTEGVALVFDWPVDVVDLRR